MNEMRKLIETVEKINEDPTVGGNMAELQQKLTELARYTEELYWNYEKYPALAKHQELVEKIQRACEQLRKEVFELR